MGRMWLSCGHEAKHGGITVEKKGWTRDCKEAIDFGSYCDECLIEFYHEGELIKDSNIYNLIHGYEQKLKGMNNERVLQK